MESDKKLIDTDIFKKFMAHVFKWEGKTSSDRKDTTAAKCVKPGEIHTNMGVTYCTYKQYAKLFNLNPSYESFLSLDKLDVEKFIIHFMEGNNFQRFSPHIAIALTETAWLSGGQRPYTLLRAAAASFGIAVKTFDAPTVVRINNLDQKELFKRYWILRKQHLENLINDPSGKWYPFRNGWRNRYKDFETNYSPK